MITRYEQIVDVTKIGQYRNISMNEIFQLASNEKISKAGSDRIKRLILCIDVQKDFMECIKPLGFDQNNKEDLRNSMFKEGALAVPGSIGDVERITRFIYNNLEDITNIICSLDTHSPQQIFHPCWWEDQDGNHPKPYTIITYEDVINGLWKPVIGKEKKSIKYLNHLQKNGKKQLCIWPYHCIVGTDGASLENEFSKMVYFHSTARNVKNRMVIKGKDPYTEMYGIIQPEYNYKDYINYKVLDAIQESDEVYVVGEAASHCVLESVKQIIFYFAKRNDVRQKITVLTDCMSCIPGYEGITTKEFETLEREWGIRLTKSTEIYF